MQVLPDLVEACRAQDFTDLVMVHEHRGEPDGLVISHMPYGPTAYFGIFNTVSYSTQLLPRNTTDVFVLVHTFDDCIQQWHAYVCLHSSSATARKRASKPADNKSS